MIIPPIVDQVRAIARLHGWGIGAHGSMARDIDLIAVPWAEEASTVEVLIAGLCNRLDLVDEGGNPSVRPHGRLSTLLRHRHARIAKVVYPDHHGIGTDGIFSPRTFWDPAILDVSFIDPRRMVA